jgi:class 3 adenylate cyclase
MDRHDIPGITAEEVAQAHVVDLAVAPKYGVQFLTYWFDAEAGAAFCLARAPTAADLATVHHEGHGLVPNAIIPVVEDSVLKFLGKIEEPIDHGGPTNPFRTIVFTDLTGSTTLLNKMGQSTYMVLLTEHDLIIRRALVAARGREVKHTGDGLMASFDEVAGALSCAIAIQDGFDARNAATDGPALVVRIGMAAGEPVDRGDDLFGSTVNLASRICDAADGGQILVSEVVQSLGTPLGFGFLEAGVRTLKGFREPSPLFELERDTIAHRDDRR